MEKEVCIRIESVQTGVDGTKETFVTTAEGSFFEKNGEYYVMFEEAVEDSGEVIKNRLQISEKGVLLRKSGACRWEMFFAKGDKRDSDYHTPFGVIPMSVETFELERQEEKEYMNLLIGYQLSSAGEMISNCKMNIEIKSNT